MLPLWAVLFICFCTVTYCIGQYALSCYQYRQSVKRLKRFDEAMAREWQAVKEDMRRQLDPCDDCEFKQRMQKALEDKG